MLKQKKKKHSIVYHSETIEEAVTQILRLALGLKKGDRNEIDSLGMPTVGQVVDSLFVVINDISHAYDGGDQEKIRDQIIDYLGASGVWL